MNQSTIKTTLTIQSDHPDNREALEAGRDPVYPPSVVTIAGIRVDETRGGRAVLVDYPPTKPGTVPGRVVMAPHEARAMIAALEAACRIAEGER